MAIQIKKRISLDFLGDEYKEAYLEFNSVAMRDYETLIKQSRDLEDKPEQSLKFIQSFLLERFMGGKFPENDKLRDIQKEELLDFDAEVFLKSFQSLTGQLDPKA